MARYPHKGHRPDYLILSTVFVLVVFGLIMLASASSELGQKNFGDTYYYLKRQLVLGVGLGLIVFAAATKLYYRHYQKLAAFLFFLNLGVFSLVFTDAFGGTAGGASRWLRIGDFVSFQPAEFFKITYIAYIAAWISNTKIARNKNFFTGFVPFMIITGLVAALLIPQPATSTVGILILSGLAVYFVSGAPYRYIAAAVLFMVASFALVIALSGGYRLDRILTFYKKENTDAQAYHISRAQSAIGSGGFWGMGFGRSIAKTGRLPATINDSIFAVIASEFGFVGSGMLVALFGFLTFRIYWLAYKIQNMFGRLLLTGFGTIIGLQAFVNMASMLGLIPLTGLPLQFISYGGTAMIAFFWMMGIIVNISKHT